MIREIEEYVNGLEIIDTHEHLAPFEKERPKRDFYGEFLYHYFCVDLVSAGLAEEDLEIVRNGELSALEKWDIVEKFWDRCRFTGYGQALSAIAKDIYGIDEINRQTVGLLNKEFLKTYQTEHYKKILKEKCNIKVAILDYASETMECDSDFFVMANRIDPLVCPGSISEIRKLESDTGVTINTFENYLSACEARIHQFAQKSKILKCGLAYDRSLYFERAEKCEAEKEFNRLFSALAAENNSGECRLDTAFSDYVFHYVLEIAQKQDMILQIHAGIQEGNGNILRNSDPVLLNRVFLEYPKMKFDIFHIGYPYQSELGVICKMFPNVHVDMCWAHSVSPIAAQRTLSEWLELMPYTKIHGFGGDSCFIDGTYGHLTMARKNIAEVLSSKVEQKLFSLDTALKIGKALLYDNPAEFFGL